MAQGFTTQNLTTTGGLSAKMATYYDKRMLSRLRPKLVFNRYGEAKNLPKNAGKTVQWYRRTDMGANTTALAEGTTPNPITMAATSLSATLAQYGDWTQTSDLISMTSIDDEINHAVDVLSFRAARTVDALDRNALDAEVANAIYGDGTVTTVGAITPAMSLKGAVIREAVRKLKAVDAEPFGNNFALVAHPNNVYDLFGDTASGGWQQMNTYVNTENADRGVVGKYFGAEVTETTELTVVADGADKDGAGAGTALTPVYRCHLIGKGALGTVNFDGGTHILVKKPSAADTSNPLDLYSTVGYKMTYANKILDANRQVTLFLGSNN